MEVNIYTVKSQLLKIQQLSNAHATFICPSKFHFHFLPTEKTGEFCFHIVHKLDNSKLLERIPFSQLST